MTEKGVKRRKFVLRHRETNAGLAFLFGAINLLVFLFFFSVADPKRAWIWVLLLGGSSIPLIHLANVFLRETLVSIDSKHIKKKNRTNHWFKIPWDKIYAVTIEQGNSIDRSVLQAYLWTNEEEYMTFITTDEVDLDCFSKVARELKRYAEENRISYSEKTNIAKKKSD